MKDKTNLIVLGVAVAVSAAFVFLLVYGYPRLFPGIEASHPDQYRTFAADALAAGNPEKALLVARQATEHNPKDPVALMTYGRVLMVCGQTAEAVNQLKAAVSLSRDPGIWVSRDSFYSAPARFALGKYYFGEGQLSDAVVNFELGRVCSTPGDESGREYGEDIYQAYARQGMWARALEYREPTFGDRSGLDIGALTLLGRVGEGVKDWSLVDRAAQGLLNKNGVEGRYLFARARFSEGKYGEASALFRAAAEGGRAQAAYFLGQCLEREGKAKEAIEAYLAVGPNDVYRPFALARAAGLLDTLPEQAKTEVSATSQQIFAQIEAELPSLCQAGPPLMSDKYERFKPVSFAVSPLYFESGAPFPLLVVWKDRRASLAAVSKPELTVSDNLLTLRLNADTYLQLQWVKNEVNWTGVDLAGENPGEIPGWIDTARDWFGLRKDYVAEVASEADNPHLRIDKMTWFYSVPVPAQKGKYYLAAARVRAPQGRAGLRFQGIHGEEKVVAEEVARPAESEAWGWASLCVRSQLSWDRLRLQLEVQLGALPADFDDVMVVAVEEPAVDDGGVDSGRQPDSTGQ